MLGARLSSVCGALELAPLSRDIRCLRNRADALCKQGIHMLCVGDAFERTQVQLMYESIFDSALVG